MSCNYPEFNTFSVTFFQNLLIVDRICPNFFLGGGGVACEQARGGGLAPLSCMPRCT